MVCQNLSFDFGRQYFGGILITTIVRLVLECRSDCLAKD